MTNFDFIKAETKFDAFSDIAVSAEKIMPIDYASSALTCRRAMEFAVKWMYSVDSSLVMPWDDKLGDCGCGSASANGIYSKAWE